MLKFNEFSHNHHLSKVKMLVNISDVEFRKIIVGCTNAAINV